MSKPNISLTKTCVSCGQQKPMSAFLQLTGTQGTTYGNICATCRKSHADKPAAPKELEDSTRSSTGAKIDAKTKVKAALDKRELRKQVEENYFDERDKQDEKKIARVEKVQSIAHGEKKHRLDYLEKRSFLDSNKKPNSGSTSHVFGGEDQKAKAGKIDFATGPVEHTRVAGLVKTSQSPIYQSFKNWLGNAPIVSAAEKAAQKKTNTPAEKKAESESLDDYANKTWGPSSRK